MWVLTFHRKCDHDQAVGALDGGAHEVADELGVVHVAVLRDIADESLLIKRKSAS